MGRWCSCSYRSSAGDTGLWFVPTGEVLPARKWSFSVYRVNFDYNEGFTDASNWPVPSTGIGEMKVPSRVRFAELEGVKPEPLVLLTPVAIFNRPGLDAVAFRAGTHASFYETMQARLSSSELRELGRLRRAEVPHPVGARQVGTLVEVQDRLVERDPGLRRSQDRNEKQSAKHEGRPAVRI